MRRGWTVVEFALRVVSSRVAWCGARWLLGRVGSHVMWDWKEENDVNVNFDVCQGSHTHPPMHMQVTVTRPAPLRFCYTCNYGRISCTSTYSTSHSWSFAVFMDKLQVRVSLLDVNCRGISDEAEMGDKQALKGLEASSHPQNLGTARAPGPR